jgi:methanogenic corrinoid protein MtbC1
MQIEPILHRTGHVSEPTPARATLNIGEVAALLALPAPTIRSWERRHALSTGRRDERGHRRYTADDVAVLRRMRDQRAVGVRANEAATTATAGAPLTLCLQLLSAIDLLEDQMISRILDASLKAYGLPVTIDEVLLPSMREVGERWSRGECDVAQEHLATSTVLAWLAHRSAQAAPPTPGRPVVLSCGPRDQHTISLEAFGALLRQERFSCLTLGAQTPAGSLRRAVEESSAQAVVLVSQLPRNRVHAVSALRAVSNSGAALFYAGAAFRTAASRHDLPGHYLGGNLSQAATYVATRLRNA